MYLNDINVKVYDRSAEDLYVDKPLTNVSVDYKNSQFIADSILPKVQVTDETGLIWSYGFEKFALKDLQRGDYSESKQSSYSVSSSETYALTNYALHDYVTEKMRKQAASPMRPEIDTTETLTDILALNKEYQAASLLFNTASTGFSGYTETLNNASSRYQWDDYTNSTPIQDSAYARRTKIRTNSGNTSDIHLVIGDSVWVQLQEHPDILERIKYTQTGILTEELVAKVMKVDSLTVGVARYNTANEGQTASLGDIWGKYALFYHKGKPAIKTSATALLLHGGNYVRRWQEPAFRNATLVEVEEAFQVKVLSARSGYLFSTAVA